MTAAPAPPAGLFQKRQRRLRRLRRLACFRNGNDGKVVTGGLAPW